MAIGEVFQLLRKERGITQSELAKAINLTGSAISSYEKGITEPSLDIVRFYAGYFNVSADFLLELSTIRIPNKYCIEKKQEILEMVDEIYSLSKKSREVLKYIIASLKAKDMDENK